MKWQVQKCETRKQLRRDKEKALGVQVAVEVSNDIAVNSLLLNIL